MKIFSFKGRINRLKYFFHSFLSFTVLILILSLYTSFITGKHLDNTILNSIISSIAFLIIVFYFILEASLIVRRLHDLNITAWYGLYFFVPLFNIYWGLRLLFEKGTLGTNFFGNDPIESMSNGIQIQEHSPKKQFSIRHIILVAGLFILGIFLVQIYNNYKATNQIPQNFKLHAKAPFSKELFQVACFDLLQVYPTLDYGFSIVDSENKTYFSFVHGRNGLILMVHDDIIADDFELDIKQMGFEEIRFNSLEAYLLKSKYKFYIKKESKFYIQVGNTYEPIYSFVNYIFEKYYELISQDNLIIQYMSKN